MNQNYQNIQSENTTGRMEFSLSQSMGAQQFSLKHHAKKRLLGELMSVVSANKAFSETSFFLVVDEHSLQILDSACTLTDLTEHHITLVENLMLSRKPYPDRDVIYLVSSSGSSVKRILEDFQDSKHPQYGAAHLFFLSRVSPALFDLMAGCKELVRRVRNLRELNSNFFFHEANTFLLSSKPKMNPFSLYSGEAQDNPLLMETVERLFTVCCTLNQFPFIQYQSTEGPAAQIASFLYKRLKKYYADHKDSQSYNSQRAYLLVLDRNFDLYAPVMHDFMFGELVFDFLQKEKYSKEVKYATKDQKGVYKIDLDNDSLWNKYKGKHFSEVLRKLPSETKEFTQSAAYKGGGKVQADIEQAKKQPKYNDLASKFRTNLAIAKNIVDLIKEKGVQRLIEAEQMIITGVGQSGKALGHRKIVEEINKLKKEILDEEFVRLLWLYLTSYQLSEKEFMAFVKDMCPPSLRHILYNIRMLVETGEGGKVERRIPLISPEDLEDAKEKQDAVDYQLLTKGPRLVSLVRAMREKSLDLDQFPFIEMPPDYSRVKKQVKSKRKKLQNAILGDDQDEQVYSSSDPRLMVFVVGSLCYSEIISVQEKCKNLGSIIMGSHCVLNPTHFLETVGTIKGDQAAVDLEDVEVNI